MFLVRERGDGTYRLVSDVYDTDLSNGGGANEVPSIAEIFALR